MKSQNIKLIVYDFDGVMTDNRVLVTEAGEEAVSCNRGDGLGVNMIKSLGIEQIILSTETNHVVQRRAQKIGLVAVNGAGDKRKWLLSYCKKLNVALENILYIGNDVNDFEVMSEVGYPVCPSDAHEKIQAISCRKTQAGGGEGVVRELADWLISDHDVCVPEKNAPQSLNVRDRIAGQLLDSVKIRQDILNNTAMMDWIAALAATVAQTLRNGGKIIFAGNGGSFADAQHLAAEFVGRFMTEREPLAAICLGTNSSLTTAVGNDYSFDKIFSRELQAVAKPEDILIVISTSGNSKNLMETVLIAKKLGVSSFGLFGKGGGAMGSSVSSFVVPSAHTARIQEIHITVGHLVCDLVDSELLE